MSGEEYQQRAQQQLVELSQTDKQRAVLLLDDQALILTSAGQLAHFGLDHLKPGADASESLPMLYPLEHMLGVQIPFVQLPNGLVADVAISQQSECISVALTACDQQHQALQQQQQKTNELALLQREQSITLQALRHAHQQLQLQRDELDQLYSAQKHYLNKLSHEVRNPLQALLANLDGAQTLDAETTVRVQRGTLQLLTLVENLLVQGQREESQQHSMQTKRQVIAPVTLADDCVQLLRQTAQAKGLWLELHYPSTLKGSYLRLDAYRIRQILFNLMGNAIRYTRQGGIDVVLELNDDQLIIKVKDSGPGIKLEDQQRLFAAYQRGGESMTGGEHGAGLGLTISRELAGGMQGSLSLQSTVGVGSTFELRLPALAASNSDAQQDESPLNQFKPLNGHAVLVDDDVDWQLALGDWLQQWELKTTQCSNLESLRELLVQPEQSSNEHPNWLILDQNLPDGLGVDILDDVCQCWPVCGVLVLSGESIELPQPYLQVRVLRKPVTRKALYDALTDTKDKESTVNIQS